MARLKEHRDLANSIFYTKTSNMIYGGLLEKKANALILDSMQLGLY